MKCSYYIHIVRYNWSHPLVVNLTKPKSEEDLRNFAITSAHSLNESFYVCTVMGIHQPCQNLFQVIETDAGKMNKFDNRLN